MEREMVDSPMMQRDMAGPMMTVTEEMAEVEKDFEALLPSVVIFEPVVETRTSQRYLRIAAASTVEHSGATPKTFSAASGRFSLVRHGSSRSSPTFETPLNVPHFNLGCAGRANHLTRGGGPATTRQSRGRSQAKEPQNVLLLRFTSDREAGAGREAVKGSLIVGQVQAELTYRLQGTQRVSLARFGHSLVIRSGRWVSGYANLEVVRWRSRIEQEVFLVEDERGVQEEAAGDGRA